MAYRILKTVLLGLVSTGVFASEVSFAEFAKMVKESREKETLAKYEIKVNYADRLLPTLKEDRLISFVKTARKKDQESIDSIYNLFFDYLNKKDFKNAYDLGMEYSQIVKHNLFTQPAHLLKAKLYIRTLTSIGTKITELVDEEGRSRVNSLVMEGEIKEAIVEFDRFLGDLRGLSKQQPENSLEKYRVGVEIDSIDRQKWEMIIKKAMEYFFSPDFFVSIPRYTLVKYLYTYIFDELKTNPSKKLPIPEGGDAKIPFFFYTIHDNEKVLEWMRFIFLDSLLADAQKGMKGELIFSPEQIVYIAIIDQLSKRMDHVEGINFKAFYKRMDHVEEIDFKAFYNMACKQDNKRIQTTESIFNFLDSKTTETLKKGVNQEIEKAKKSVQPLQSWDIFEKLIQTLRGYQNPYIDDEIQRIKKERWAFFINNHGPLFIQTAETIDCVLSSLFDDFKSSTQNEKDQFYNNFFLQAESESMVLFFYGINLEKFQEFMQISFNLCNQVKGRPFKNCEIHRIFLMRTLSQNICPKIYEKSEPLYRKALKINSTLAIGKKKELKVLVEQMTKYYTDRLQTEVNEIIDEFLQTEDTVTETGTIFSLSSVTNKKKTKTKKVTPINSKEKVIVNKQEIDHSAEIKEKSERIQEIWGGGNKELSAEESVDILILQRQLESSFGIRVLDDYDQKRLKAELMLIFVKLSWEEKHKFRQRIITMEGENPVRSSLFHDDDLTAALFQEQDHNSETVIEEISGSENNDLVRVAIQPLKNQDHPLKYPAQWSNLKISQIFRILEDKVFSQELLDQWMNVIESLYRDFKDPGNKNHMGHSFSRSLYALKKLAHRAPQVLKILEDRPEWVKKWFRETKGILPQLGGQGLANSLYALAELKVTPPEKWMNKFTKTMYSQLESFQYPAFTQINSALRRFGIAPLPEFIRAQEIAKDKMGIGRKGTINPSDRSLNSQYSLSTSAGFSIVDQPLPIDSSQLYWLNGVRSFYFDGIFYPIYTTAEGQEAILLPDLNGKLMVMPCVIYNVNY